MFRALPHGWHLTAFSPLTTLMQREVKAGWALEIPVLEKWASLIQHPQLSPLPILGENLYGSHFSSSFFFSAFSSSFSHLAFLFNFSPLVSSDRPHVSESPFWHQTMFISCFSRLCEKKAGVCLSPSAGGAPSQHGGCLPKHFEQNHHYGLWPWAMKLWLKIKLR